MVVNYVFKSYFQYFFTRSLVKHWNFKYCYYDFSMKIMNAKPPNILVYTGSDNSKLFKEIHDNLQKCLQNNRYTIYHLLESEINNQPWMENSLLLIISGEIVNKNVASVFETYLNDFGNILLICSKFNNSLIESKCLQISEKESLISTNFKEIGDVFLYRGCFSYCTNGSVLYYDSSKKPLIHKVIQKKNVLICSEIYLDRDPAFSNTSSNYKSGNRHFILKHILSDEFGLKVKDDHFVPQLTPGVYTNKNAYLNREEFNKTSPLFYECKLKYLDEFIKLPIYFLKSADLPSMFNIDIYFSNLYTEIYGHQLVYFPVISSTMDVAEQLSEHEGIVCIASSQISGKGRRSNQWISPKGCAMFTLHFTLSLNSQLGKRMSLLQHIASLAVVHGIKSQSTYQDLDIKIKWPNDIYHNKIKLGGLIATSTVQKNVAHVYVGWGINVTNSQPTTCLNDIIKKYNLEKSLSLPYLCTEKVVAYTLSQMEYLVKNFIEFGPERFFSLYYSHWMHNNQEVTLKNLNEQGVVIGLDDYGFLRIKTNGGTILTVQPDGNRFDIMKNLIYNG